MRTRRQPTRRGTKPQPINPMSWYRGSQLTTVSADVAPTASAMSRTVPITLAWERTTPRGAAVLPDVYWRKQTSVSQAPGSRAAGAPASRRSGVR
jgi:hypothetical protein